MNFFKRLFCRHRVVEFVRNLYGDHIHWSGGNRSVWECVRCGASVYRPELHRGEGT